MWIRFQHRRRLQVPTPPERRAPRLPVRDRRFCTGFRESLYVGLGDKNPFRTDESADLGRPILLRALTRSQTLSGTPARARFLLLRFQKKAPSGSAAFQEVGEPRRGRTSDRLIEVSAARDFLSLKRGIEEEGWRNGPKKGSGRSRRRI